MQDFALSWQYGRFRVCWIWRHDFLSIGNITDFSEEHAAGIEIFYYQLMHIMLKNTELLKHSKITLQHVSVYIETIFRELQSVLG